MSQITIKLLHEAEGHIVTVETKTNEVYRGYLIDSSDTMNCQLMDVTLTTASGETKEMKQVFLRGSKIRFMILPEILRNAPMFQVGKGAGMSGVVPSLNARGNEFGTKRTRENSEERPYKRRKFNQ